MSSETRISPTPPGQLPQDAAEERFGSKKWIFAAVMLGLLVVMTLLSRANYLLFHAFLETTIAVIAFSVFIVAWTAREHLENNYLRALGLANLFIGVLALLHMMSYKGMGVFPGYTANLPTQLWIATRYLEGMTLLMAPLLIARRVNWTSVAILYLGATVAVIALIFSGNFPVTFVDGSGLTPFKIASEYAIMGMVSIGVVLLYRQRNIFGRTTYRFIVAANLMTIAAGLMFTLYTDVYGILNVMGHVTILASFILIFLAIVRTGIVQPHELVFRSLKRSEDSIRAERDFAQAIIQNAQAIIMVVDPKGTMVRFNPFAAQVSGRVQADLTGLNWGEALLPAEERDAGNAALDEVVQGEGTGSFSSTLMARDGGKREIEWRLKWLEGGRGRPGGVLFIGHDMTEKRALERELEKRADQLVRSNDELQQFAYVASHDLQEPLRMVISYLDLLERKSAGQLDDRSLEYLHFALDGGKRMRVLIDDLLTYSRVDSRAREFTQVDIAEVVRDVEKVLGQAIEEGNARIVHSALPVIYADQGLMILLLQNLIGNAIKYRGTEAPEVRVTAIPERHGWVFKVADNGIGIDPRHHKRIFSMFQRLHTRDEYPGTGIGLAISKKIVERHGGRIWVESEEGKGATFIFTIPKARKPSAPPSIPALAS